LLKYFIRIVRKVERETRNTYLQSIQYNNSSDYFSSLGIQIQVKLGLQLTFFLLFISVTSLSHSHVTKLSRCASLERCGTLTIKLQKRHHVVIYIFILGRYLCTRPMKRPSLCGYPNCCDLNWSDKTLLCQRITHFAEHSSELIIFPKQAKCLILVSKQKVSVRAICAQKMRANNRRAALIPLVVKRTHHRPIAHLSDSQTHRAEPNLAWRVFSAPRPSHRLAPTCLSNVTNLQRKNGIFISREYKVFGVKMYLARMLGFSEKWFGFGSSQVNRFGQA